MNSDHELPELPLKSIQTSIAFLVLSLATVSIANERLHERFKEIHEDHFLQSRFFRGEDRTEFIELGTKLSKCKSALSASTNCPSYVKSFEEELEFELEFIKEAELKEDDYPPVRKARQRLAESKKSCSQNQNKWRLMATSCRATADRMEFLMSPEEKQQRLQRYDAD